MGFKDKAEEEVKKKGVELTVDMSEFASDVDKMRKISGSIKTSLQDALNKTRHGE